MEVAQRYVEQFQTTAETMRRRGLAAYDAGCRVAKRSKDVADRLAEVAEPVAYDCRDYLAAAVADFGPAELQDRENRLNLLELYLAASVLTIGVASGEMCGALVLSPLLDSVFDRWVQLVLLFAMPIYVYLSFRKNGALDDTERRVWLFGMALAVGSVLGNVVGQRLISVVPGAFFVAPMALALLVDSELSPSFIYTDRNHLIMFSGAIGGIASMVAASFPVGSITFAIVIMSLAHSLLLFVHFQLVLASMKSKTYGSAEALIVYVLALFATQLFVAIFFGSSKL